MVKIFDTSALDLIPAETNEQYTLFYTQDGLAIAALPVGHTRSLGISGLTLGGGFGFLTRFSGLLCDRIKSL